MNERQAGQSDFPTRVLLFSNWDVRVVEWHRNQHIPILTLEHAGLRAGLKCCGSRAQGEIPRVVSKCPFNSNLRARLRGLWLWAAWGSAACVCRDDWNNMTPSRRRGTRHGSLCGVHACSCVAVSGAVTSSPDARQTQAVTLMITWWKGVVFHVGFRELNHSA